MKCFYVFIIIIIIICFHSFCGGVLQWECAACVFFHRFFVVVCFKSVDSPLILPQYKNLSDVKPLE